MYTLLKPLLVREKLLEKNIRVFTPREFMGLFSTSPSKTKYFLERQVREGLLLRLKKGLYSLKTDLPLEEEIANALYKPSYISFEYALAYHNLLLEMPYTVTSATTKPTRLFTIQDKTFSYRTLKTKVFTGYSLVKKGDKFFLIADPEKALCDYLYLVTLKKSSQNERLITKLHYQVKLINKIKLLRYANLFGRSSLIELIKKSIK